ncbi:hypothetical protein ACFVTJ_17475 [Agrobacterium sp. NPDC058088]|uniref:hypothetical protein n=1 Tax=Agrobacterium sp. NPDC058088 TaxID=3346335 RepID=UPI0036D8D96B
MIKSKSSDVVESSNYQTVAHPPGFDAPQPAPEAIARPLDTGASGATYSPPESTPSPAMDIGAETEAPLVDIALASVRNQTGSAASSTPAEELAAMRAEFNRLSDSVTEMGSASVRVLRAGSENMVEDLRVRIRAQPAGAILLGLLAGYIFGAKRRQ